MEQNRKSKFSMYATLTNIKKWILILSIDFRKCEGKFDFLENGMADLEHDRKLKFSRHTHVTYINYI